MSPQWMWKSAGQCHGPVGSLELQQLLQTGRIRDDDDLQVAGSTEWIAARELSGVFAGDGLDLDENAADTAAMLLVAAGQLRQAGAFDGTADPPERPTPPARHSFRPLRTKLSARRALLTALLLGLNALLLQRHLANTPSNAAAFARLSQLADSLAQVHMQNVPGPDNAQSRQVVAHSAQELADQLASAAERLPLVTLTHPDVDPDAVLARRELLFAARELTALARSTDPSPVLNAEFRKHLDLAAAYLDRGETLHPTGQRGPFVDPESDTSDWTVTAIIALNALTIAAFLRWLPRR